MASRTPTQPLTSEEHWRSLGYDFEERRYTRADGSTFVVKRPVGLDDLYPVAVGGVDGRPINGEELTAIWRDHSALVLERGRLRDVTRKNAVVSATADADLW